MLNVLTGLRPFAAPLICAVVAFIAAWSYQGERYTAKIETIKREQAEAQSETIRKVMTQSAQRQLIANQIDAVNTENLREAHEENARLRAAADADARRVSVRAKCPAAVPTPAVAGSVDYAAVELAPDLRQAVFDFRSELIRQGVQLKACQEAHRANQN